MFVKKKNESLTSLINSNENRGLNMIQLCPISRGWRSGECWGRGEYMAQWWGVAVTLSFPPSSRWLTCQDLCVYLSQCLSTCSFSLYVSTCLLVLSLSFSLSTFPSLSLLAALSACLLSLPVSRSLSHSTVSLSNCLFLSLYIFISYLLCPHTLCISL